MNIENKGNKSQEYKILFPKDNYALCHREDNEGMPSVIVVNLGLKDFRWKDVFGWYCSIIVDFKEMAKNEMPTSEESKLVLDWLDEVDKGLQGDKEHPNALFIARETYHGTVHAMWQVNNPKIAHQYLQEIINNKSCPRDMDYVIEPDEKWEYVDCFFHPEQSANENDNEN